MSAKNEVRRRLRSTVGRLRAAQGPWRSTLPADVASIQRRSSACRRAALARDPAAAWAMPVGRHGPEGAAVDQAARGWPVGPASARTVTADNVPASGVNTHAQKPIWASAVTAK